jgi:hypothetical protein
MDPDGGDDHDRLQAAFFIDWTCDGVWAGDTGSSLIPSLGTFTPTKVRAGRLKER